MTAATLAQLTGVDPAPRPTLAGLRDDLAIVQSQLVALHPRDAAGQRQKADALNHLSQAMQALHPRGGRR